jgi:hypothetical protein
MGDSSNVFPVAMGVIVFIVALSMLLTIPSFQQTIVNAPMGVTEKEPMNPAQLLGSQYTIWIPVSGFNITTTNTSNNYYSNALNYEPNNKNLQFTDPRYATHHIDARIIRNNTNYGNWQSDKSDKKDKDGSFNYQCRYYDYIAFDGFIFDYGFYSNSWYSRADFDRINESREGWNNYSLFELGVFNITGMLVTPGDGFNFTTDLYTNNFTLYIVQLPQINYNDFLQVLWYIISFNNSWMPSAPWFALIISSIVDVALALLLLFIAQGFIP